MRLDPKSKGERSEGMILAALLRAGKVVLQPFGDNQRYDLVIDEGTAFTRVQCKTARLKDGALLFDTCSSYSHRGGSKKDYSGQADVFGVYSPDLDKVYLVPVGVVGKTQANLRLDPPRNGQKSGIRIACEFELYSSVAKRKGT
jgi:hypothetical protein